MGALTPQFVFQLENRMRAINFNEYLRVGQSNVIWWDKVAKRVSLTGEKDILHWMVDTVQIEDRGYSGGDNVYRDMQVVTMDIRAKHAGAKLRIHEDKFNDINGGGYNLAAEWAKQAGAQAAYWPQKALAALLKTGESAYGYDGQYFFSASHPVDGANSSVTFANLFTGAENGTYPGACPIDTSVTLETALTNLSKLYGYFGGIKASNGVDPRFLVPSGIICSPKLYPRAVQLCSAKTIATAAGSLGAQGGSSDVEALVKSLGYGQPLQAFEFAGWESDTTFFVVFEDMGSDVGACAYGEREPFQVNYYSKEDGSVTLGRSRELEWDIDGRNEVAFGHPFLIAKCKGS